MTIAILEIPGTNIRNLLTALPKDLSVSLVKYAKDLPLDTSWIILPGVGHFASYMTHLKDFGWVDYLASEDFLENEQKLLGICSGFHALCQSSEEALDAKGLGLFDVDVVSCPEDSDVTPPVKSPHVGRKPVVAVNKNLPKLSNAFFTHSFTVQSCDSINEIQRVIIGGGMFVAAMKHGKIHGVQYHPELSGDLGSEFLKELLK